MKESIFPSLSARVYPFARENCLMRRAAIPRIQFYTKKCQGQESAKRLMSKSSALHSTFISYPERQRLGIVRSQAEPGNEYRYRTE